MGLGLDASTLAELAFDGGARSWALARWAVAGGLPFDPRFEVDSPDPPLSAHLEGR
jgi:hypothetical protein